MRVDEAIELMTKGLLQRVVDSFTKDFPKSDEERAREIILRNSGELTDPRRIEAVLAFDGRLQDQIRQTCVLEALIGSPDCTASELDVVENVTQLQQQVLDAAASPQALRYEDARSVEVLRAVMRVALKDAIVTNQELELLRVLRESLGLSPLSMRIIQAQLEHFPRKGNLLHTAAECREALLNLQRCGIVFYCNRANGGLYVIPEEVAPSVRRVLGIELSSHAWGKLLSNLTVAQLATILRAEGMPESGKKEARIERVVLTGVKPSTALARLSKEDLYHLCTSVPGLKISGSKPTKITRIVRHFANLVIRDVAEETPPGERYYQYLVELAARDRANLLTNRIVTKDREIEGAFEEGTRFLFSEKLGLELQHMEGTDHADGCITFGKTSELLLWDNKSKETVYTFPPSHLRQFKRYIRDAEKRVSCFLIIVPSVADEALANALRLKSESGSDTDVALIAAEDLVWVAEEWRARSSRESFNLEVLNATGILTRTVLDQRMRLFL
ncbi:SAP domain-containing protein [Candidatus Palauibacter sp.]|uniref:SAP domain-containing protein n=1 Tax=Candidatus Palauibacter sp. TaxID=3101350 RepID=UPI003C6F5937